MAAGDLSTDEAPALALENISKTFGDRRVLTRLSLEVGRGEVLGLIGQNGSGKSTLIKILSSVYEPDRGGTMRCFGSPVVLPMTQRHATELGLVFVHQDLGLFEEGSILENMRVGHYRTGFGFRIKWKLELQTCRDALARVGLTVDPRTKVAHLNQVDRALVAIARAVDQAMESGSGLIILDEPTSYLPRDGVEKLFHAVRDLKSLGMGVVFVSHRIDEVLALADVIAVMRDGQIVARFPAPDTNEEQLVEAMLGRTIDQFYPDAPGTTVAQPISFEAVDVVGDGVTHADISVREGEIIGVTGLLGMGQERLLYLLNGSQPGSGYTKIGGTRQMLSSMTPRRARDLGMALLPADRVRSSGVQEASVLENLTLATLGRFVRFGRIRHRQEHAAAMRLLVDFDVRPPAPDRELRTLSGGNQQKVLLAKWISCQPRVLLLHEPTQGVDVGAKQQIFKLLREAADRGVSIIIATTEYEDLAGICNRVIVMRDGRTTVELGGVDLTHDRLVEECYITERTSA